MTLLQEFKSLMTTGNRVDSQLFRPDEDGRMIQVNDLRNRDVLQARSKDFACSEALRTGLPLGFRSIDFADGQDRTVVESWADFPKAKHLRRDGEWFVIEEHGIMLRYRQAQG